MDAIKVKDLVQMPKEKEYSRYNTNSQEGYNMGYNQAIEDIGNLVVKMPVQNVKSEMPVKLPSMEKMAEKLLRANYFSYSPTLKERCNGADWKSAHRTTKRRYLKMADAILSLLTHTEKEA